MTSDQLKERTKAFALAVIRLIDAVPPCLTARVISNQLVRSATSIGANYRAACRAQSRAEFAAKLSIVVEETDETPYWLELIRDLGLVKREQLSALMKEASELLAIAVASRKTAKSSGRAKNDPSRAIVNRQSSIINFSDKGQSWAH